MSHLQLFESRPNKSIYFTDIDSEERPFFQYNVFELDSLPNSYLPNNDSFFELSDCNAFEKIQSVIKDALSRQKSENEYPANYSERIIKRKDSENYYNRIHGKITTLSPIKSYKSFDFGSIGNLIANKLEHQKTTKYASFAKSEPINREKYASQYN